MLFDDMFVRDKGVPEGERESGVGEVKNGLDAIADR